MSAPPGSIPPPPPFLAQAQPLPPFWTEHLAPAGHSYWYNSQTKISTYSRPLPPPPSFSPLPSTVSAPIVPIEIAPIKEKKEKPKTKTVIGESDWTRVVTNKGNTFYTNRITKESVWSVPGEIRDEVTALELLEAGEKIVEGIPEEANGANGKKRKNAEESSTDLENVVSKETIKVEDSSLESLEGDSKAPAFSEAPPTKRKKVKKQVVRSIEELETDEDWQRSVAAQMVEEVEEEEKKETALQAVKAEEVETAPILATKANISTEEGTALFKTMLSEKDIEPFAPWDNELPKFINDSRYTAVRNLKDRRDLFDQFCKEKIRSVRAAKKAAQDAGIAKADPLTAYKSLLKSEVTSTRTHFSDFKKAHQKDARFREFGKTEGEKEKVFKIFLRDLGEKKREDSIRLENGFKQMLSEFTVKQGDEWSTVKSILASDSRYLAIPSSSQKEAWFKSYLQSLSNAPVLPTNEAKLTKETKAARAQNSLKEREEQVAKVKSNNLRSMETSRGLLSNEGGEREFRTLLVDQIRDHQVSWETASIALSQDPRFSSGSLSQNIKRRLFDSHLTYLYQKRLASVHELFAAQSPDLVTPFHQIAPQLIDSAPVLRLIGSSSKLGSPSVNVETLEGIFNSWKKSKFELSRAEFHLLLKENPILEHWGRLQKSGNEVTAGDMKDGGAEDEEDDGDEVLGLKEMAMQIDLKAVEAILKHDKRYLVFDHVPIERSAWIDDYIKGLAAPSATVHSKK